jgi:hypothetical protein
MLSFVGSYSSGSALVLNNTNEVLEPSWAQYFLKPSPLLDPKKLDGPVKKIGLSDFAATGN